MWPVHRSFSSFVSRPPSSSGQFSRRIRLLPLSVLLAAAFATPALPAQTANRITQEIDPSQVQALPNHLPQWANPVNHVASVPPDLALDQITMVLSRSPRQEQAFEQFLADQQNPASPDYHHWLTPAEVGDRFGLSDQDIAAITGWLQSQGLHVNWVAPSRNLIRFGGRAADIGRALQTELHYYKVNGDQRFSVSSDPMIPQALAPAIKAIHGLYTIDEKPLYQARSMQSVSPEMNANSGNHYLAPADFATIYDLPSSLTGTGMTIGIVDRSRTDFADFDNFRYLTGANFSNPTEIVPTAFGGVDPGPAYTSPPGGSISTGEQGEATLDVLRAGSVALNARLLLVVATSASGGIEADAEYLIETSPVPAQIMTISFGACEYNAGASGVTFWDTLFQQAAAEGISVFVSSGDAGASGCDTHGSAPPASPLPNSPNFICSSSYATCVGGTEFNDASNPSLYWSSSNGAGLKSALSYIPEGAWNDSTTTNVAASGGGVSSVIATPSWQTGTGVPAARAGRYTPDIAFSSSGHDGYFGCFAAAGASCVVSSGSYTFEYFYGTSAAAPDMAGVTALLDQQLGAAQGNLNPEIYSMAATVPAAFHDVTVATSGVTSCSVTTPSLCNNSIPSPTSQTGGQPGYLVTTGYDEVTGLGSLDVSTFIGNYISTAPLGPWTITGSATAITGTSANLTATVNPNGLNTHAWFLYGTSSTLSGATQTPSQNIGNSISAFQVGDDITGLSPGATYYFQAVAQNSNGTTSGTINSFTTAQAPAATTGAASQVTDGSAALAGTAIPNGADTHVWFLYGTSNTLSGAAQSAYTDIGSGTAAVPFAVYATGLNPGMTYYFQAVAQNSVGTTYGAINSFSTATGPLAPTATTLSASQVTASSATLSGYVNPSGADTHAWFLYGASSTLNGATQTTSQDLGSAAAMDAVNAAISGLNASTTYYFQAVAQNSVGTTNGTIQSFTTAAAPSFSVAGTAVSVTPGATTGNTSTITITPANGFTRTVNLTCAITPTAANDPATCSVPASVTISGTTAQTVILTVYTTGATALNKPPQLFWPSTGGAVLALVFFFRIPKRRRNWLAMLALLVLFVTIAGIGCGGGGAGSGGGGGTGNPGTTAGSYTITVTGTSGSTVESGTVTLTVL